MRDTPDEVGNHIGWKLGSTSTLPWRGASQLTVGDQATSRRKQLKAGLERGSADWVEHGGHTAISRVGSNGLTNIFGDPINDVVGHGSANRVNTPTARNADDIDFLRTSIRPNAQAAPQTSAERPFSGQTRESPPAVSPATSRHPPFSKLRSSGIGTSIEAGAVTKVAHDPITAPQQTRVRMAIVTADPVAATVPDPSPPSA